MFLTKLQNILIILLLLREFSPALQNSDVTFTNQSYVTAPIVNPCPILTWKEVIGLRRVISGLGIIPAPTVMPSFCRCGPLRSYSVLVSCDCTDTTCTVTQIMASSTDLSGGIIHSNISFLENLKILDLSNNQLTGSIPDSLGDLKHLEKIRLFKNQLTGKIPSTLGNLSSLKELALYKNMLSDKIPKDLGSLRALQTLRLEMNKLKGEIPAELGNLKILRELKLGQNNLTGHLPSELGNLTILYHFDISSNNLTGVLPDSFVNLTSLYYFSIAGNNLTGAIPTFIGKNWTNLRFLYLLGNEFEGELPPEIFNMPNLQYLLVSDLNNSGFSFPDKADMSEIYYLVLRNCSLKGSIPEYIGNWKELTYLDLSFNQLTGEIPRSFEKLNLTEMSLARNMLTGEASWITDLVRHKVDLSYNNFIASSINHTNSRKEVSIEPNRSYIHAKRQEYCGGQPKYNSLFINCGGSDDLFDDNGNKYEIDNSTSNFFEKRSENEKRVKWMYTCSGDFLFSRQNSSHHYIKERKCGPRKSLYKTCRLCPVALTYYAFCLREDKYTVRLHFSEIVYSKDEDYSALGRRAFDVYIQGERVMRDFDIKAQSGGPDEDWFIEFPTIVNGTLEIHLQWAGKGSIVTPPALNGPLLSAISVTTSKRSKKLSAGQIAGITIGSVFTPLLLLLFMWQMGWLRDRDLDEKKISVNNEIFSIREIINGTRNFHRDMVIGDREERFGKVYKAVLTEKITVAVKKIASHTKQKEKTALENEIVKLRALENANVVQLLGGYSKKKLHLLIYEFMEKSLDKALSDKERKLDWKTRFDICRGIARGLKYLHEENGAVKIVHGNISPKIILLDQNNTAKLSDFGLATVYEVDPFMTFEEGRGPLPYIADECLRTFPKSVEADVFSFGVVMLEIVSGERSIIEKPKQELKLLVHEAYSLHDKGLIMSDFIDSSITGSDDRSQAKDVCELALKCTHQTPNLRPKISVIDTELEKIQNPLLQQNK